MVRLASLVAFAGWIIGVCAQDPGPQWPLNVSVGGVFDEIAPCSKLCILAQLELSGCGPLDPTCYCAYPVMETAFEACFRWYCTILDYYDGLYQYHRTCNSPVQDAGPQLKKEIVAVAAVALLALILRFITRLPPFSVKWGTDDWLASLLVLVGAGYFAVIMLAIESGFGKDMWLLTPQQVSTAMKYFTFEELGYVLITFLTKITVLTFYLRIFPLGRIRTLIYLFLGICVCLLISIFLAHLLQCLPIAFNWEQCLGPPTQSTNVTCAVERDNLNWAFGITNVILDGIIMVLSLPKIISLELKLRRKLGLLLVFSVGFLITGIGIVRLVMLLNFHFTNNKTWTLLKVVKWCGIEAFLSIVVTCFPQIHLLGKRILGIWYTPDHSSQHTKPSFVSSQAMMSQTTKEKVMYENIEMGLK